MRDSTVLAALALGAFVVNGCSTQFASQAATQFAIQAPGRPVASEFPAATVARGAQLAAIGNCATCHTAKGGKPYAGGFPVQTPFGIVYGTNLTPDPETGLGNWSGAAFRRALREGLDREGNHLYPAFPYDHFTMLADDDITALYAFLMTRDPVRAEIPANTVIVPRVFIALWKTLYFRPGPFRADPALAPGQVHGAYLSEALAHCSSCHTPRNKLGAEKKDEAYAGGDVGGWLAPALNSTSTSPVPWTIEAMTAYLRTGIADAHAIAAGPMAGVTRNLAYATPDDIAAIAAYTVSLDPRTAAARNAARAALVRFTRTSPVPRAGGSADARADLLPAGARLYAGACADCHDRGRGAEGGALQLQFAIAPTLPSPANLAHIIRDGIVPQPHERSAWMPPFAGALTDDELAALLVFLRARSGYPPWDDVSGAIRAAAKARE